MLNSSLSELQMEDGSSPNSVSKATVSLAALEINRCARLALREERSLAVEEDPFPEGKASFRAAYLSCSETIPECPIRGADESLDCVSVGDTISQVPDDDCISDMHDHSHHDDFSLLSVSHTCREEEDGHQGPEGDSKLKVPKRTTSESSRRGSADSGTAATIDAFLNSTRVSPLELVALPRFFLRRETAGSRLVLLRHAPGTYSMAKPMQTAIVFFPLFQQQ